MRNLKRALSLTLASVMLLGMMVVGSSAASFPDVDSDEHNIEAIDVLQTVGVMVGDADTGNFRPNDNVKRSEMARIMADLMDLNYDYYTGSNPFTDMEGHWAEKYVAACYTNGIIAGRTETTYDPEATVTAVEAAAMLMRALGYFQNKDADYQGGFVVATVRQAGKIDLFNDVATKTNDPMTRNDVAQLVLNTLKSGMVEPDNDSKIDVVLPGGGSVSIGATNYVYVTSRENYAKAIYDTKVETGASSSAQLSAPIVELGEKLYQGDLKLKDWRYGDETDDFGRPATTWTYQAKDIGTYAEETEEYLTFTAKVTSKKLYDAVGKTAAEKYDWTIRFNGTKPLETSNGFAKLVEYQNNDNLEFYKAATGNDALTGNGTLTQVYVDGTKEQVVVSVTEYYAAEVYKVNTKDGKITLNSLDTTGPATTNDEFAATGFEEDDVVYYTFAKDKIQSVDAAERVEGTVTKVVAKVDDSNGSNFSLGDDNYKYNKTVSTTYKLITENVDNDMVGYLDGNGYVIYVDQAAVSYDYAYVLSLGENSNQWGGNAKDYSARLLLTDGTIVKADIDWDGKGTNPQYHIVSYTKDKNGMYSLAIKDNKSKVTSGTNGTPDVKAPAEGQTKNIFSNGKAAVKTDTETYTANSNTVFLVADKDGDNFNNWDFTVYTGVKNAPDIDAGENTKICVAATDNKIAKVVYVQDGDVSGNGEVVFVLADAGADLTYLSGTTRYHELTALIDGEVTSIYVKRDSDADKLLVLNATENFGDNGEYAGLAVPIDWDSSKNPTKFIVPVRLVVDNSENQVTNVKVYKPLDAKNDGAIIGNKTDRENKVGNEVVILGNNAWTWASDVKVGVYDMESEKLSASRISSVKKDDNNAWVAVLDDNQIVGLCMVDVKDGNPALVLPKPAEQKVKFVEGTITPKNIKVGDTVVENGTAIAVLTDGVGAKAKAIAAGDPVYFFAGYDYEVKLGDKAPATFHCDKDHELTITYAAKDAVKLAKGEIEVSITQQPIKGVTIAQAVKGTDGKTTLEAPDADGKVIFVSNDGTLVATGEVKDSNVNVTEVVDKTADIDEIKVGNSVKTAAVTITGEKNVIKGKSIKLTATVSNAVVPNPTITWSVDPAVTGVSISSDGTLTVAANVSEETTSVTVKAASENAKTGAYTVAIVGETDVVVTLAGVPSGNDLRVNEAWTIKLTASATVGGKNAENATYAWSYGKSDAESLTAINGVTGPEFTMDQSRIADEVNTATSYTVKVVATVGEAKGTEEYTFTVNPAKKSSAEAGFTAATNYGTKKASVNGGDAVEAVRVVAPKAGLGENKTVTVTVTAKENATAGKTKVEFKYDGTAWAPASETVVVTSEDGKASKTYTITVVTEADAEDAQIVIGVKDEGSVVGTVTEDDAKDAIEAAQNSKDKTFVIDVANELKENDEGEVVPTPIEGVTSANVSLDAGTVTAAKEAGVDVAVKTPVATVSLDKDAVTELGGKETAITVEEKKTVTLPEGTELPKDAKVLEITVTAGGEKKFTETAAGTGDCGVSITMPEGKDNYVVVHIAEDGTMTLITEEAVSGGDTVKLPHLSCYTLIKDTVKNVKWMIEWSKLEGPVNSTEVSETPDKDTVKVATQELDKAVKGNKGFTVNVTRDATTGGKALAQEYYDNGTLQGFTTVNSGAVGAVLIDFNAPTGAKAYQLKRPGAESFVDRTWTGSEASGMEPIHFLAALVPENDGTRCTYEFKFFSDTEKKTEIGTYSITFTWTEGAIPSREAQA